MCDLRIEQGLAQINALLDYTETGHRNDEVHGGTDDAAKDKQEKTLDAKITAAYQQPEEPINRY